MLCSACQTKVRPVVVVDIDGTLGDYYTHFVEFAEQYLGKSLPRNYDGSMEFSDYLQLEKQPYREIKLAFRQGSLKRWMPRYPGSTGFMNDLRTLNLEIWIATTRPWLRLDNVDPDTRWWLEQNKMPFDYMIYGEDKYEQLVQRVDHERILCVVDDLIDQCYHAVNLKLPIWQIARDHNSGAPFHVRGGFKEILDFVAIELDEWEGQHG